MNFKTRHQRLKSIEIYRSFYVLKEKSDEHLFILLKSEEDLKNWELARDTCKYIKSKKVHVFLENGLHWSKSELANEYFVTIEIDESETQDEHELRNKTLSVIKSTKVSLQGCDVTVGEIFSNGMDGLDEDDICDFLTPKETFIIGSELDFKKSNEYIGRRFNVKVYNENTVKKIKQNILPEYNETYVIFSEQEENIFDDTWIKCVKTIAYARKELFKLKESAKQQDTIHLCMYKNKEIHFMYLVGEQSNCIETEVETERKLVENTDNSVNIGRVTILTGVAGMGKTTSMASLALRYKENHPSHLVYFIELSKHIKKFQNPESIKNATQFVAKEILKLEGLEYKSFVNACNKNGQVALFLDAFDEISPKADKALTQVLLALEETKIAKIFVSSRAKCIEALENTLLLQAMNFVEFSTVDKENCLMKYWKQMLDEEDNKELNRSMLDTTVTTLIRSLAESEEKLLNKLIAIPLQIIMVAKVYYKTMVTMLEKKMKISNVKLDLLNLYQNYLISFVEHFFIDKLKVIKWDNIEKDTKERYIREKLRGSSKLAYKIVVLTQNEFICDLQDSFLTLQHDLGIIINDNPPIFSHRTIAEYLAAQYIVEHRFSKEYNEETANIIEKILMEDKYEVVRIFINSLLNVKNLPLYFNKIDENEKIVTYADGLNNPIHVAATEGNSKLLEALLNKDKSLISLKNEYGETALSCACRSVNADIGRLLIKHNCSVDTVDKKGNNVLHCASYNGNVEILKLILNPSTNAYTTADLETLTLSDNQKLLLNMQNDNGCTPLHCAVHRGKLNVVEFLIEQPDCKLDIVDKFRGNALHNAAHYNNVDIMKVLLQRDIIPLDMLNKRNKTALHIARSRGSVEAAELLYNANAKHTS